MGRQRFSLDDDDLPKVVFVVQVFVLFVLCLFSMSTIKTTVLKYLESEILKMTSQNSKSELAVSQNVY